MVCRLSTVMETHPTIYMVSRATPCYLKSNSFLQNSKSTSSSLYFYLSLDKNMCLRATEWITPPKPLFSRTRKQQRKRSNVRIHRLNRRERKSEEKVGKDMELENLKLYKENMSIMEENNKLRKKATLLHQENLALMSELIRKKFSHSGQEYLSLRYSLPPPEP
ncbi:protein LITTLE ZIPPER 1-like isoform X2 [Rhododendron vialii]|uniref:protein LITTLE ZIPPER 1-like isoform X2 n=1 Tax=Rhododendron vialii TaxID=182163 RepID=UPI00265E3BC6|nr:protein LITTLE ZIPPER 1-like isoform X2 [Rhododendron vialii]